MENSTFSDTRETNVPPGGCRRVCRVSASRLELGLIGRRAGRLPAGDVRFGFGAFAGRQQQVGMVEKTADTRGSGHVDASTPSSGYAESIWGDGMCLGSYGN